MIDCSRFDTVQQAFSTLGFAPFLTLMDISFFGSMVTLKFLCEICFRFLLFHTYDIDSTLFLFSKGHIFCVIMLHTYIVHSLR